MPGPGGSEVGRVSVRVVPDSTKFRATLQAELSKIERNLQVTMKANLDRSSFDRQVNDLISDVNGRTVELNAKINSKLAKAEIAQVSRSRFVDLSVKINKASLATAGAALARLSGGRAVTDNLRSIGTYLADLDKNIPKLAATSLAIASIGSAALSSVGGALTLGAGLSQLAGLSVALPALLTSAAIGGTTLALALKDTGKVLEDLGPRFQSFQKSISGKFWDEAEAPIRRMVDKLLPDLQAGMGRVSNALGGFTMMFSKALTSSLDGGALDDMMAKLAQAIRIAAGAAAPLVSAFTTLGQVGTSFLPGLAQSFVNISTRFQEFIFAANADGSLKRWVTQGVGALALLGASIGAAASILGGLFKAADAAGGGGLAAFAGNLQKIADVVNGPAFQGALTTVFQGAAAGLEGLGKAIGPIGKLFESLAPTIASVMATAGNAVGGLLTSISSALASTGFANGLTSFFDGIATGLAAIGPALPAVATALGALGGVAGALAGNLGGVLGAALSALAPVVTTLATALQPLIPILGAALVSAVQTLAPALQILVSTLAANLAPVITQLVPLIAQMAPAFAQLIVAIAPLIPPILSLVAAVLQMQVALNANGATMAVFMGALTALAGSLSATVEVVTGAVQVMTAAFSGNFSAIPNIVVSVGNRVVAAIDGFTGGAASRIVTFVANALARFASWVAGVYGTVSGGFARVRSIISSSLAAAASALTAAFSRMKSAASAGVSAIVSFVASLPGKARSALGNVGSTLYSSGGDLVRGFLNGMSSMIGSVAARAAEMARRAVAAAKSALKIGSPSRVFQTIGQQTADGLLVGLDDRQRMVNSRMAALVHVPSVPKVAGYRSPTPDYDYNPASAATGISTGVTINGGVHGYSADDIARRMIQRMREEEAMYSRW